MNLRALEAFYWIVQLGGFRAAASKLNMTQPAISVRIRELERGLGVQLFQRGGRTITLTAKGRELVEHAERVLVEVNQIGRQVASAKSMTGLVRPGFGEVAALIWLPSILKEMSDRFPGLLMDIHIDLTVNLYEKLLSGDIDIAVFIAPISSPKLRVRKLGSIPMVWAIGRSLTTDPNQITQRRLSEIPLISLSRDTHMHIVIQDWFAKARLRPASLYTCNQVTMMMRLVSEGFGAAILPRPLIEGNSNILALEIDCPMKVLDFVIATRRTDLSGPIGILEDVIVKHSASS
jgi:DNA-binding transcriptional LysR family regulator